MKLILLFVFVAIVRSQEGIQRHFKRHLVMLNLIFFKKITKIRTITMSTRAETMKMTTMTRLVELKTMKTMMAQERARGIFMNTKQSIIIFLTVTNTRNSSEL